MIAGALEQRILALESKKVYICLTFGVITISFDPKNRNVRFPNMFPMTIFPNGH